MEEVQSNESVQTLTTQLVPGQDTVPSPSASSDVPVQTYQDESQLNPYGKSDVSISDEEDGSEVESFIIDQDIDEDTSQFLLSTETLEDGTEMRTVDPETQARLEALLEAAGIGKLCTSDGKAFADPEVLRRLTSSVSSALDEAAAALTRMRAEQQSEGLTPIDSTKSLAKACSNGDIGTVRQLLDEGRSVHETTEEGESLLSLACSAGYYELAQVLLAMRANVEDRGIKGDCTPLMEAASGGYVDIVRLLIAHGADVNAQSSAGNTPLHYAACGGHETVVHVLLEAAANVEEHNENGHTPLMEAASAGHVGVASTLLEKGAGINTHSNEFKESALTLACYKGHLDMVKFLLEAGADHEHKTDEMHTALMEACMDGHVDVARLLLNSGAQVNMPIDSFESPLTLAACGGHVELANLLIERGANLEEVNDEGYTPLMEAAREGHEDMVALLLAHGADINGQTEETQETALTLACCGGFQEVADFLIKAGGDLELGCTTPLIEAAQEGHLELVKYMIKAEANVNAQTQTGDTALTYACENGHTDVAEVLLDAGAELEHESEGGRTPLMKAARAGHLCTVQFLISKGANVNRSTSTSDHTVLSLACAGGHLTVVELLLRHGADSTHKLKDGSTMLIEAAKGGHTSVVNLLLDWPRSILSPTQTADLSHLSSPTGASLGADHIELPRVPMHGLGNIVPPQDPNQNINPLQTCHALNATSVNIVPNLTPSQSTIAGEVNLKELNTPRIAIEHMPHQSFEQIKEKMRLTINKNKQGMVTNNNINLASITSNADIGNNYADCTGDGINALNGNTNNGELHLTGYFATPDGNVHLGSLQSSDGNVVVEDDMNSKNILLCDELSASIADSVKFADNDDTSEDNIVVTTSHSQASDRLEAFINKMMKKAELLNSTREEQILKKQQILEELQKVGNLLLDSVPKQSRKQLQQSQLSSNHPTKQDVSMAMKLVNQDLSRNVEDFQQNAKPQLFLNVEHDRLTNKMFYLQNQKISGESCIDHECEDEEEFLEGVDVEIEDLDGAYNEHGCSPLDEAELALIRQVEEVDALELDEETLKALNFTEVLEQGLHNLRQETIALTCAPNPVPLHEALKNDVRLKFQHSKLCDGTTQYFDDTDSVLKQDNKVKDSNEQQTIIGDGDKTNISVMDIKPPQLAKQESISSLASSVDSMCAPKDAQFHALGVDMDSLVMPDDGTCVDGLPSQFFSADTGSPARENSEESNWSTDTSKSNLLSSEDRSVNSQQGSRASSEEVDLTNVVPMSDVVDMSFQYFSQFSPQQMQLLQQQLQQHQLLQHKLALAKVDKKINKNLGTNMIQTQYSANPKATSVIFHNPQLQQLQNLMTVPFQIEALTTPNITPGNAAAIQQQLEQQRQQLQAQLGLQQQLQHELQQQLKLQQEHEHLKQQLKQHQNQVLLQQKPMPSCGNDCPTGDDKISANNLLNVETKAATTTFMAVTTTTNNLESLQQEINQQELQQLKLQQVQQHLQQLHQQIQQVQQLQNNHQLTQQELLLQAQQLQVAQIQQLAVQHTQSLQAVVAGAPIATSVTTQNTDGNMHTVGQPIPINQMAHLLTHEDLFQHTQQLQQLAQLQHQQNQIPNQQHEIQRFSATNINNNIVLAATTVNTVPTMPVLAVSAGTLPITNSIDVTGNINTSDNIVALPNGLEQKKNKKKLFSHQFGVQPEQQHVVQHPATVTSQQLQLLEHPFQEQLLQQQHLQQLQVLQQQQYQQQLHQQQLYQLQQQQYQQQQVQLLQQRHQSPQIQGQSQGQLQNPPYTTQPLTQYTTVANNQQQQLNDYYLDLINPPPSTPMTPNPSPASPQISPPNYPSVELDAQTESNHDTALTLACAGGHAELVTLLLSRGADIEHRDKKGFTPLILASTAGHLEIVEVLVDHQADVEAQSERTKDTPLSLACSGGRYEVVELLLNRGANKEHRNVSDYTPLSLAASGGYVNIIKLLLSHGAEINSRTGSKLGISPLMLAAMNGHAAAVKLLLDMGSDINAQIETNRNTALTLACFQGRHEVVSLLVDRKANIEHRAKTGLTPLMEAASGGYVEVGRVLLDKGADVNATPVPSSRDTALTIAADKGHIRFVELLIQRGALIDVKNKKGNSPLWLACNGGHLDVDQLLVHAKADVDSQDNRKVSCLMAAFRKGHIKVVKWMVKHVQQFPSDQECMRFIHTVTDKELLKKCHQCMEIIVSAKDRQAAEANKNASILLEEIDAERSREKTIKERAARKREKRRMKKQQKQEKERTEKEMKEKEDLNETTQEPEKEPERKPDIIEPNNKTSLSATNNNLEKERKEKKNQEASYGNNPDTNIARNSSASSTNAIVAASLESKTLSNSRNERKKNVRSKPSENVSNPTVSVPVSSIIQQNASVAMLAKDNLHKSKFTKVPEGQVIINNSHGNIEGSTVRKSNTSVTNRGKPLSLTSERKVKVTSSILTSTNSRKDNHQSVNNSAVTNKSSSVREPSHSEVQQNQKVVERNSKNATHRTPLKVSLPVRSSAEVSSTTGNKSTVKVSTTSGIGELDDFGLSSHTSNMKSMSSKTSRKENTFPKTSATTPNKNNRLHSQDLIHSHSDGMSSIKTSNTPSPKKGGRRSEEGWKEVIRKSKKIVVPANQATRVIGKGGTNINAIRDASGANIEIDKIKGVSDKTITIKGSADATKRAHDLITALIKDPDKGVQHIIPKIKGKIVNTNTLTISSNVWHNSMANNIVLPSSKHLNSSTALQQQQQQVVSILTQHSQSNTNDGKPVVMNSARSTTASTATKTVSSRNNTLSSSQSGVISNSEEKNNKASQQQPPIGSFQVTNGTAIWGNPSEPQKGLAFYGNNNLQTASTTCIVYTPDKNPSLVSKQLFNDEKSTSSKVVVSTTSLVSAYSSPSMAKTTLVATSSPTFSTKVEATVGPRIGTKRGISPHQQPQLSHPQNLIPGLNGRPHQQLQQNLQANYVQSITSTQQHNMASKQQMPQPLPIKVNEGYLGGNGKPSGAEYSPFHNFFSQVTEGILGSKKDDLFDNRMNFASVAAAGVVPSTSCNVNPAGRDRILSTEFDPSKAPGYKAPGQKMQSPGPSESGAVRSSGYRGNLLPNSPLTLSNNSQDSLQQNLNLTTEPLDSRHFMNVNSGFLNSQEFSRIPGYNQPNPGMHSSFTNLQQQMNLPLGQAGNGFHSQVPDFSQQHASPRSTPFGSDHSPGQQFANAFLGIADEEYSSPHTPMTLPKIESNLNPNAPHFMCRTPNDGLGFHVPPALLIGRPVHPYNQPYNRNQPSSVGMPNPNRTPQQGPNIHPAFRPNYPLGASLSTPHLTQQQQQHSAGFSVSDLQSIQELLTLNAGGFMGQGGNIVAGENSSKGSSPLLNISNGPGIVGESSKDEHVILSNLHGIENMPRHQQAIIDGSSSLSHSAGNRISTTSHLPADTFGLQHPIGTERGQMISTAPKQSDVLLDIGELNSPGLWGYSGVPDIQTEWFTSNNGLSTSTVMTTTVASSCSVALDQRGTRPHSQPALSSATERPGSYVATGPSGHQHLEPGLHNPHLMHQHSVDGSRSSSSAMISTFAVPNENIAGGVAMPPLQGSSGPTLGSSSGSSDGRIG